jgi:hypothetical protein
VYIATHSLLNLEGPQVKASIPDTFTIATLPEEFSVRNLRKGATSLANKNQINFVHASVNIGGSRPLRLGNLAAASALASPPVFSPTSVLPPRNPWNQMWQHHDSFVQQNTMNHHLASNMSVPRIVVPTHSMVPMFPSPDSASKL